jgi:threonine aldolase
MNLDPVSVRASCTKFLSYDYPISAKQLMQRIADYTPQDLRHDEFGHGELPDLLESRLVKILGKEAAVFMPTGRMAQLVGLQQWCRRRSNSKVAMHPRCHLEESESKAYAVAYGLEAVPLGEPLRVTTPEDIAALVESVGVISLEIPLLALGCRLPSWADLVEISKTARARGLPLHADAARLWESQPYYQKPYESIAGLFDSLYVSTYKGLSAISGGALVGPRDLIEEARLWQLRLGGTPRILAPYILDSLRALDQNLPLMERYYERACSLAAAFGAIPAVWVTPNPPQTNTFLVAICGEQERLRECAVEVASQTGLWLVDFARPAGVAGLAQFQVVVGEATLDVENDEAVAALINLIEKLS